MKTDYCEFCHKFTKQEDRDGFIWCFGCEERDKALYERLRAEGYLE